ncbi:hypothetical protein GN958_ATG08649 [Phytophthora infestans]|uniref:Uncharacterized protein n=1 Tax=Phytophthora infestans TaxID=4787 RepID=A0A8S9UMS5_PHYIN|nr:hypothetical protein GN958_ATG08649 [Phytophthora infestans]
MLLRVRSMWFGVCCVVGLRFAWDVRVFYVLRDMYVLLERDGAGLRWHGWTAEGAGSEARRRRCL